MAELTQIAAGAEPTAITTKKGRAFIKRSVSTPFTVIQLSWSVGRQYGHFNCYFRIAGNPPTIPIWLNARVVRLPVGINYNLANVSKLIMNLSKIAFRSIYAVVAFAFALWQVMIYSAFRFTFTGNEGIGVQALLLLPFGSIFLLP